MSVDKQGFLSPEFSRFTQSMRQRHGRRFAHLDQISELGQKVLPLFAGYPRENYYLVTGALFMRGLQSLQGAIIMIERGMNHEARTLTRSCFESLFYLGSSVRDPDFSNRIALDHIARMEGLSRAHSKYASEEERADLSAAIEDMKKVGQDAKGKQLGISDAADSAEMRMMYDGFYKGLSNDSAHPTLMSLRALWDMDESTNTVRGLQWGPATVGPEALDDTLELLSLVGICLIEQANKMLKNDKITAELETASLEYKAMLPVEVVGDAVQD
jgi:hypothetical protein